MSERMISSKEIRVVFKLFARLLTADGRQAEYELERSGGGWMIYRKLPSGGGAQPFGTRRMNSKDLLSHMQFAMNALEESDRLRMPNDAEDEDNRCQWCRDNNVNICRHIGM